MVGFEGQHVSPDTIGGGGGGANNSISGGLITREGGHKGACTGAKKQLQYQLY